MSGGDSFFVPLDEARSEITVKRSKFIASLRPVSAIEEADDFVAEISKEFFDATHNCWAYRLRSGESRRSDDGEPSGTAGQPILNILSGNEVFNAACVVTRYFGGTLLGTGGLIRAYSEAAGAALKKAGIGVMLKAQKLYVAVPYNLYEPAMKLIEEFEPLRKPESDFMEKVEISFFIEPEKTEKLEEKLRELSSGKLGLKYLEKDYLLKQIL